MLTASNDLLAGARIDRSTASPRERASAADTYKALCVTINDPNEEFIIAPVKNTAPVGVTRHSTGLRTVVARAHEGAALLWIAMPVVDIAPESIAFVVLLVTSAVRMAVDPGAWRGYFQKARCLLPFALLCMWCVCAAAWSSSSTSKAIQSAPIRPLFGLAALLIAVRGPWPAWIALAASSTVMLTISAVKVLANPSLYSRYSPEFPGIRNNYSSTCLIAGALITGSVAAMIATRQRRYVVVGAVPLSVAAIVLRATGSRTGAIAALIGTMVSVVSLVMSKCARRWRLVIAVTMLTVVGGALFLNSAASNRLIPMIYGAPGSSLNYKPVDGTAAFLGRVAGERGPIWFVALSLAGQRPIFGWGSKSWKDIYPAEVKRLSPALGLEDPQQINTLASMPQAHNTFLQVFVEQGAIGLILLCWVLVECWHRSKQVQDPILRAVLLGVLMVWLTQGMSEPLLNFSVSTVFLGLIIVTTAIPTSMPQQPRL